MINKGLTRRGFLQTSAKVAGATLVGSTVQSLPTSALYAQANSARVGAVLKEQIQTADVVEFQLRQYLMKRVPPLPTPATAEEWTAEQKRLRKHVLDDVIFHGWPREWVDSAPKFEDAGTIASGKGYRRRKLRYEIVPGFWSTALLYEPEKLTGRVPATIALNGHTPNGKSAEYTQKRCINFALQGMLALSLEWLGMGELNRTENGHWFGAHLNLVGASATGLFYLGMRRGLDYLCQHPNVDSHRIGVSGLSGGAWQTIVLSALDERVAAAIPVAGYFAFVSVMQRNAQVGDIEYNPPDFRINFDYTTLTAMRAPRPTLLIYGAEDEYGIRAPLFKPDLYDDIKPFFKLYGKEDNLAWHENIDPGTHNYQLDNRQKSYAFFTKHFNMPVVDREIPVDGEIKSQEELVVGLPKDNLTILGLAKKLAAETKRPPVPAEAEARAEWARLARTRLKKLVRYNPMAVKHAWAIGSTRNTGLETVSYRFEFSNELSATGVWLRATTASDNAPMAIVLDDNGMQSIQEGVFDPAHCPVLSECRANSIAFHVNRGEQVLAVNLIFTGDASPDKFGTPKYAFCPSTLYTQLLASIGEQPIGMEAAQLLGLTKWMQKGRGSQPIFLESTGLRNQVAGLIAAALEPSAFSELLIREGMNSFGYLLDKPVTCEDASDLFCLDLYKEFDIDSLVALTEPTKVVQTHRDIRSN